MGVPTEQIQKQIISGTPIVPPPPVVPTPPPVEPTPPPVVPTPPPVEPTPPPVVPVVPTPPPVVPPPPPSSGGGGYTPPPQIAGYMALFSNMSAANGTSLSVLFPDETTKSMVFDATNKLWRSSDNEYIVTSTDGNFSYIKAELNGAKAMYVNTSPNPLFFQSFTADNNASGYLVDVSGLVPIALTWGELVTSVKSIMDPNAYNFAIKYEQYSYPIRKWDYTAETKLFKESFYYDLEWHYTSSFAALYSDISNVDTSLSTALSGYLSAPNYANFYIHGVPEANQNLKSYGTLSDGGKWYFTYDNMNSDFNTTTIPVYGTLPITDAIVTSSSVVPFMSTIKGYPIYVVDRNGSKEMYSIKNFESTSNSMYGYVNDHFLKINTDYVSVDGSSYFHTNSADQQNVYLFYKIDADGNLVSDPRNGKMVNPISGNALNLYTNYHDINSTYVFGPINNPNLEDEILPTPATGNRIYYYNDGITPLPLNIGTPPDSGANFRKLAIEKAPWSDKPFDEEIHIYSDYSAKLQDRNFSNIGNTQTYIKFPTSGNGVMMDTHFDVLQEKDNEGAGAVVKNYLKGSITTGRVVENSDDSSNKVIFKHFDTMAGIVTSDSPSSYGTTHNMYLFNEKDQFVNADIGGLDNDKAGTEKYNWFVHEEVDVNTSKVVGVDLMKKVADDTNADLFKSDGYNLTFATGTMSGFMIGGDSAGVNWMGDITAFDTKVNNEQGLLTITTASDTLSVTTPVSMDGLTQNSSIGTLPSASFVGEDMQAMIIESKTVNSKTYDFAMSTLPDAIVGTSGNEKYSYQNDYSSWGYWVATEKDEPIASRTYAQGYWVAGYETPTTAIDALKLLPVGYTYSGNVLGNLFDPVDGVTSPILLDASNSFKATISFGSQNLITITEMQFKTIASADIKVADLSDAASVIPVNSNTFSGSTRYLNFKGKFYGPDAQSIGGAWSGLFGNSTGTGVFKAVKTGEITLP